MSDYSPYFLSKKQLIELKKDPKLIGDIMALPNESVASSYDVYAIKPKNNISPKVFISKTAPTKQGKIVRPGGGEQIIVPNRKQWTDPVLIETI